MRQTFIVVVITLSEIKFSKSFLKDFGDETNFTDMLENQELTGLGVIGGAPTDLAKFPCSVIFLNYEGMCAGVILSSKIVLTAAHCLDHSRNLLEMRVYANSRYLFDQTADVHQVWDFLIHERYNKPIRFSNDIALLIIHDKFRFKPTVQKASLINKKGWMVEDATFQVSGWGETYHGGKNSQRGILSVDLQFMPVSKCKDIVGTALSPDMFCLWGDGTKGTCRGDSGAGVLWNKMVVGIVSHGGACGQYPGIYSNVFYFRNWINVTADRLYHKFCNFHQQDVEY